MSLKFETAPDAGEPEEFDDTELRQRIAEGECDAIVANSPLEDKTPTRQFPERWLEAAIGRYIMKKHCGWGIHGDVFYEYRPVGGTNGASGLDRSPDGSQRTN